MAFSLIGTGTIGFPRGNFDPYLLSNKQINSLRIKDLDVKGKT